MQEQTEISLTPIPMNMVFGYRVRRQVETNLKFSVVAVNKLGQALVVVQSDMSMENACTLADQLNTEQGFNEDEEENQDA